MDKKALRLLSKHRIDSKMTEEEKQYCIDQGVLTIMDPISHDELIQKIQQISERISMDKAVKAFLYSISTGDYRYRTALSSLLWAKKVPEHELIYMSASVCAVCGDTFRKKICIPNTVQYCADRLIPAKTFMQTDVAGYVLNDLLEFEKLPDVMYRDEDIAILNRVLGLVSQLSSANKVNALLKLIAEEETIELTAADVLSVLGVLASLGVFDTPEDKGICHGFVPYQNKDYVYESEMYYPLHKWRAKYGIHLDQLAVIFGKDIASKIVPMDGNVRRKEMTERTQRKSAAENYFTEKTHFIEMDDSMRYYYGLTPNKQSWDKETRYSATYDLMKRTEIYFEGDVIKKVIYEECKAESDYRCYREMDFDAATIERKLLIPKTSRGREKRITPTLLMTPTYMMAQFEVTLRNEKISSVIGFNCSNDQLLPIPTNYILEKMQNKCDFHEFTEQYIALLPEQYDEVLYAFQTRKRIHVKVFPGDVFRISITPTLYSYCLVIGRVREIEKWEALSKDHPIFCALWQPVFYRQYGIVTDNPNMTVEELKQYELLEVQVAQDNQLVFGTYPIIGNKKLVVEDIDFGISISRKLKRLVWNLTVQDFDDTFDQIFGEDMTITDNSLSYSADTREYKMTLPVYTFLPYHEAYESGILHSEAYECQKLIKQKLANQLKLSDMNPEDDYATRFGGITREQYIAWVEEKMARS